MYIMVWNWDFVNLVVFDFVVGAAVVFCVGLLIVCMFAVVRFA